MTTKQPPGKEFEVFSYEGHDVSFTIYMFVSESILDSNIVELEAWVYTDDREAYIAKTRAPLGLAAYVRSIDNIETWVSTRVAEALDELFFLIIFQGLSNKYVPPRLALRPWYGRYD